jgi:hypothetical protein
MFLAATVTVLAALFFSPGTSSSVHNYYRAALTQPANAAKRPRAARGNSSGEKDFDYAKTLNKSLRLEDKGQEGVASLAPKHEPKVQQSKLAPDVFALVGPVSQDQDLRDLPYIPANEEEEEDGPLRRYPRQPGDLPAIFDPILPSRVSSAIVNMPSPLNTFAGMTQNLGCGGCLPPDTDGDVGPNHYMQSVNSSIRIHDKAGNVVAGPITYNSFFAPMGTSTPCGNNANGGDGIVFYDHIADRWVVSDFAFPAFPGTAFYQCIGVSKTSDPVAGGYWLYAVQIDPANNNFLGDYPKFGLWPDAYYLSVNMFSNNTTFNGVRMFALDRNQMVNGGPANTVAFTISPADIGAEYSLVPASFRTGSAPPAGQPEWFMSINSSAVGGTVENQVFVRRFHVDFVTPANSVFGVGASHSPDGVITVANFVDAFDSTGDTSIVPNGTATTNQFLDTLGDKLMYPLIYQNLGGVESVWVSHSVNNNQAGTGPVSVRWYQFNMSGNTIPATPAQQQTFDNGADGLWRWMPSINVDWQGNMSIGYSASSTTVDPGIRYAGRLASDPPNTLSQGEAIMTPGTGHQTSTQGRWGDYSTVFVDPADGCTFYHTNEYFSATSGAAWNTRVGSYKFPTCSPSPIPTPTPLATPTPTPTPVPTGVGPVTVTATAGTLGPTDYATVKLAFDAINAGTHQGAINVFILGDTTETVAAVLNASGTGAAVYSSIVMRPTGVRTVSGNLATPLIDLNGADVVTIDGLNAGGNSLTFSNTNNGTTAGTSTIRFINGASSNIVKNCSILGSATVALGTAGGNILFSTTAGVTVGSGNNSNIITTNNIGPAGANLPIKAISALGTAGNNTVNLNDVISSNNIFDFFGTGAASVAGIDLRAGNNDWTISGNRIYQTAPRTFTGAALRYSGILFSGTASATGNFHTFSGNTIGFGAANGTGTTTITGLDNEFRGIDIQGANSGTTTSVQGNIISGINQTSSRNSTTTGLSIFAGIQASTAAGASATGIFDIGTVTGNTIGSLDGSSTIVINATSVTANTAPVFGILAFSGSSNNVSNNNIGALAIQGAGTVTGFRGIFAGATVATTHTINNNTIGGPAAAGAITNAQVGSYALYGIQTATAAASITGNTIRNLNGNANGPALVIGGGIALSSTSTTNVCIVARNTVHSLTNNSGTASNSIYAIDLTLPVSVNVTGNLIERNFVHSNSITSTDNTSQIWGIVMRGAASGTATATFQNNMIRLGIDKDGNSITGGFSIIGIRDIQGAGSSSVGYYFNSVYIGGTGVGSSSNTFALNSGVVTTPHNYRDNIFWNARSNASGAGKNYAIALGGTTPNPAGLTSNFNDLFANGTGGFVGLFNAIDQTTLANWQTATGQDANSISADPKFFAPTAPASGVNLHIFANGPAAAAGTPIAGITNDFDNDLRPAVNPDIGADEVPAPTASAALISGQIMSATGVPLAGVTVNLSGGRTGRMVTDRNGEYRFNGLDVNRFYTVTPAILNYSFTPESRSFSLLANRTDAAFTGLPDATSSGNVIDTPDYFVRQHYVDFLGREPDESGFNFWTDQIRECGADSGCVERRTINVSAAYFLSIEFMETGGFVDGLYRTSYGHRPLYADFMPDTSDVARGVIVGTADWSQTLQANKQAFLAGWVARPAFRSSFDGLSNSQFVDTLISHTGVTFAQSERDALVGSLNQGASRAEVLGRIAANEGFVSAKRNEMFVMMQYFGYLRRDPDESGFNFWLQKLNQFNGNFEQAEMVKAFIVSGEYRDRFRQH